MSDRPQTISLDFLASQLQRLFTELREIKTTADLDRRNGRAMYDNLAAEMSRAIGAVDAKLEIAVAHLDERLDVLEQHFDRVEGLLADIARKLDA